MSTQEKKISKPRSAPTKVTKPSYKAMISEAVVKLADKKGSSRQAIRNYVQANYTVTDSSMKANFNKTLRKLITEKGLVHPKSSTGLFKLCKVEGEKKQKTKAPAKKPQDKSKKAAAKKPAKKSAAKKPAAKKTKTKKSTKKPAVKKVSKKIPKKAAKKPLVKKTTKKVAKKATKK